MQGTWTDNQGAVFSADKTTLLKCPDVEQYIIPNHVVRVEPDTFDTAPNLRRIDFNQVHEIPNKKRKKWVEVPDFDGQCWQGEFETIEITEYANIFEACSNLEEIEISENTMTSIAEYAFAGLKNLKAFCVPHLKNPEKRMDVRVLLGSYVEYLTLADDFDYRLHDHWGDSCYGNPTHFANWLSPEFFPHLRTLHILFSDSSQHIIDTLNIYSRYRLEKVILPKQFLSEVLNKQPNKEGVEYIGE